MITAPTHTRRMDTVMRAAMVLRQVIATIVSRQPGMVHMAKQTMVMRNIIIIQRQRMRQQSCLSC